MISLNNNKLSGEIPVGIRELKILTGLWLNSNNLHGTITEDHFLFNGLELTALDLSSNQLVGTLPTLPPGLIYLDLSGNNLSGTLPSHIIGAPTLQVLYLSSNSFSGTIPCSLLQSSELIYLDISNNLLNGTLPNCPQGHKKSKIKMLKLNNNSLSGVFPLFLQRCRELIFLDLASNNFSGNLPTWLGSKLPQLALLQLRSNMFSGRIPNQLTRMEWLQFLDIAYNNISGNIPQSLGNLIAMTIFSRNFSSPLFKIVQFEVHTQRFLDPYSTHMEGYTDSLVVDTKGQLLEYTKGIAYMVFIDLSCNRLEGKIPQEIGKLAALKNINLSWNSLSDIIPQTIGELHALESFDLSHNQLSGEIPTSLSALTSLARLNLSYNNLTGTIPSGNQLRTLDDQASIYIGNPGLCGPSLIRNCSRTVITPLAPEDNEGMSDKVSFYLSMCIGFVVGLWIVFIGFLFKRKWRVRCFSFSDHVYDRAYVQVVVGWASLARKFRPE
jgi:Leucine-rich repeat (LRR) protein